MNQEIPGSSVTSLSACSWFIFSLTLIPPALILAVTCFGAHFFMLLLIGYICGFIFIADALYFLLRPEKKERALLIAAMLSCMLIQLPYISDTWLGIDMDIITGFLVFSILLVATHAAFFGVLIRNRKRKLPADA